MYCMDPEQYICQQPFLWFEIRENGDVHPCCPNWLHKPLGNILEDSLEEIWNSKIAQELRQSMIDGTFKFCDKNICPRLAAKAIPVVKIKDIVHPLVAKAIKEKLTILPWGPKELNLCYDRSCNLACPSCRPEFIVATGLKKRRVDRIQETLLAEMMRDMEQLTVTGSGDPFGSPSFRTLLQNLNPDNHPYLRSIPLHTNGNLWTSSMWATMKRIHPYVKRAEISVDAATEQTYKINRRGGNWEQLLDNFAYLSTLDIEIIISFVVQENNFEEMPKFVELGNKFGFKVYFSSLLNWGTFSKSEYASRAVHRPSHPRHEEFIKLINRKIFKQDFVDMGNLNHFIKGSLPLFKRKGNAKEIMKHWTNRIR